MGVNTADLPAFTSFNADMGALYAERLQNVGKYGYGIFSSGVMFRFTDEREIEGIASADPIQLSQFVGYEEERMKAPQTHMRAEMRTKAKKAPPPQTDGRKCDGSFSK